MSIFKNATRHEGAALTMIDLLSEPDESDWVDMWLEGFDTDVAVTSPVTMKRVTLNTGQLRRGDTPKIARVRQDSWDDEISSIKDHVANVLSQFGNG